MSLQRQVGLILIAISSFASKYDLSLSQAEKDAIKSRVSSCGGDGFEEEALKALALLRHDELLNAYPNYSTTDVDIDAFIAEHGAEVYLATATLYESFIDEVGEVPEDAYQWQLAMEVFQEELLPILLEFTPGIGDLIGAYNDFQAGSYFWGCFGIIAAIVPGDEIVKVIRKADNIRDAWKNVKKVFVLWNKLFSTVGGQRVLNKLPQSWKDLPESKLANGQGLYWKKSNHHNLRIMDANPNANNSSQHVKYVRLTKNGSRWDINGNPVQPTLSGGVTNPDFQELTHIPLSEITDEVLDNFFN